jgi:hypothetical protein
MGDMVTVEEMIWCGRCIPCRNGYPNHCTNLEEIGFTIPGRSPTISLPTENSAGRSTPSLSALAARRRAMKSALSPNQPALPTTPCLNGQTASGQGTLRQCLRRRAHRPGCHRLGENGRRGHRRCFRDLAAAPRAGQKGRCRLYLRPSRGQRWRSSDGTE